jgi:hypothetical protein
MRASPFGDALIGLERKAEAMTTKKTEGPMLIAYRVAQRALDVAEYDALNEALYQECLYARDKLRAEWLDSDEEREYELTDGNGQWRITSRPSTLAADVEVSVLDGDWEDGDTWWWHGASWVIDPVTGEQIDDNVIEDHTVEVPAKEPKCRKGREHNWRSPLSVVGGIEENPGCYGHGGGTVSAEVCAYCGVYKYTDTWAQDRTNGQQGLHAVNYEDADDVSIAWVKSRVRRCPVCDDADCETKSKECGR